MPLIETQMRFRELGRIRIGQQVPSGNGRTRPEKLEHFRFTSASQLFIEAVCELLGGRVCPWASPAGAQWEVVTESDTLDVVLLPEMALTQWMELWKGGGCERRCDGEVETLSDQPCVCPVDPAERRELAKDGRACKPTTRLSVMLTDERLPDVGIYRLETHGWYAGTEMAGAFALARHSQDSIVYATLRLEQREKKVPGRPTMQYGVPVLELDGVSVSSLLAGRQILGPVDQPRQQVPGRTDRRERVPRPALPPGPPPPTETQFRHGGAEDGGTPTGSPSAPPPDPEPFAPPPDVTDDGEVLSVDDPAPFLDRLRAVADANARLTSVASRDQKREVHELLEGLGTDAVVAVLLEALDRAEFAAITTGEAQAVLAVGAAMGRDAFRDAWASAAIAIAVGDESGMGGVHE